MPGATIVACLCALVACSHQETVSIATSSAPHAAGKPPFQEHSRRVQAARGKRQQFGYRKSDTVSTSRRVIRSGGAVITEDITMVVNDPLRRIGTFEQHFIYYKSSISESRPTVLVFPLFGDAMLVDRLAARHFCRMGFNAMLVIPSESPSDAARPLDRVNDMLIRYTVVARMGIDMLEGFPETDPERIFAYGVSMGGIRAALIFGVEPRIRKAGVIAAGGDIPGIIADTDYGTLSRTRDARMAAEHLPDLAAFRAYLAGKMTIDPLDFGCLRAPEDVFFVLASGDRYVRDEYQEQLYDAFSRPREGRFPGVIHSPTGHLVTGAMFYRYVNRLAGFFRSS